jgi:pimeloyl-ACP methyl ester carboxylesterase
VLYLAASHDPIVPPRCFEEIVRELPSVTLKTIPGRHLAMYANPQPAAQAIVEFVAARPGR